MKKYMILFAMVFFIVFGLQTAAYSFGPGVSKNHIRPTAGKEETLIIEQNNGVFIGPDNQEIFLTFDCGYENGYTNQILDALKNTNTKAVFFITAHYLNSATEIVQRMIDEGHLIGNHTSSHRDFTASTEEQILEDVVSLEKAFESKMGIPMSKYVRPPRGEFTETSQKLLAKHGYKSVFWSLAYVDWHKDAYNGNQYSYHHVLNRIHNGAIILMHTVSKDNAVDLESIIVDLKADGYIFTSIEQLFKPMLLNQMNL